MDRVRAQEASSASSGAGGASKEGVYAGLTMRGIGPALMSGRVGDIAVDPVKHSTWYVAAASGGVWKTTKSGTTWAPIFDGYGSYSIGCVAVDTGNHPLLDRDLPALHETLEAAGAPCAPGRKLLQWKR